MSAPLHRKIEQDIREKIKTGVYPQNETIPTEMELSEIYDVSRPTVRQAVQSLVNEGYLEKRRKRGTIVKKAKIEQEFTRYIESFDSEIYRKGMFPKTRVLTFTKTEATEEVAENLELNLGDPVFKLTRLRFAEDKPVVFVTSFIPYYLVPELDQIDFSSNSLYATFHAMGHPIQSASRKLEITLCDETTSYLLDIQENDPLFYFHTRGLTANQVPIEYSIAKYRGDINSFVFEVSV
ncbi:MAG: GntR family transcriptional regulator [Turicibacter sp.]|nr:GntR family transcriptional regulator [Turicibacter sp.]